MRFQRGSKMPKAAANSISKERRVRALGRGKRSRKRERGRDECMMEEEKKKRNPERESEKNEIVPCLLLILRRLID